MNPIILKSIAKGAGMAYENRDVALDLLSKIKVWKQSSDRESEDGEAAMSLEDRLERLGSNSATKEVIDEEQSELSVGSVRGLWI